MSSKILNESATATPPQATIPIKQVALNRKFVPLVVCYASFESNKETKIPAKLFYDQKIQAFIQDVLNQFEAIKDKDPTLYAIRLQSTNQYINERNRSELLSVNEVNKYYEVEICFNLEREVKNFIEKLSSLKIPSGAEALTNHLVSVEKYISADKIFAHGFYAERGKTIIVDFIKECDRTTDPKKWNLLYHLYKVLMLLVSKWKLIKWDSSEIDYLVVKLIYDTINDASKESKKTLIPDSLILLFLQLIDDIINNSEQTRNLLFKELKFEEALFIIQRQNMPIKEALLSLVNTIFKIADQSYKKNLTSVLIQPQTATLLREASKDAKNTDMIFKNIAILQKNILDNDFGQRMMIPADKNFLSKLQFICNCAFLATPADKQVKEEEKFARLGFENPSNPLNDFKQTPPGILALDFMVYCAEKISMRTVIQNLVVEKSPRTSEYSFPFAKASVSLINSLCSMLRIGYEEEPEEQFYLLFVMFALSNDGIHEFFAKCLKLFYKIWNEMRAQLLDFDRALSAFKDSLFRILLEINKTKPGDHLEVNSTAIYKKKINDFTTQMDMWKYDNLKTFVGNDKSNFEPIKELKRIITDEVISMIKPKRIHVLTKGERFDKINANRNKKLNIKQQWKLSSDLRTFHYIEYENDKEITSGQVDVDRIRDVKKEELKKQYFMLVISCKRFDDQGDQAVTIGSSNEEIIDVWLDAIYMLINPKPNANMSCFIECLIDAQLLDLQKLSIEIPHEIPKIPKLPEDLDQVVKI